MKRIEVVAAVIREKDRIFATQRGYGEFAGGWEFPGGKIEPGEQHRDALKREIREELTAEIETGDLLYTVEYDYPAFHLTMYCYWARVVSGELVLTEHMDARWLSADQLDRVAWLPADIELIELLKTSDWG